MEIKNSLNGIVIFFVLIIPVFTKETKHCLGTANGHSFTQLDYEYLKEKFQGCTHVVGNLEITYMKTDEDHIFQTIEEVSGYVLIFSCSLVNIALPNLMVIRGVNLLYEKYSLSIQGNNHLSSLNMTKLREISNGSIIIGKNDKLCYADKINWPDLTRNSKSQLIDVTITYSNCGKCDDSCNGHCWAGGKSACQHLSFVNCPEKCRSRKIRCYKDSNTYHCCHDQCYAGCNGSTKWDCLACMTVYDNGGCEQTCSKSQLIITGRGHKSSSETKRKQNYNFCIPECPDNFLIENNKCVTSCEPGVYEENEKGVCEYCYGNCKNDFCLAPDGPVNDLNIDRFVNCTKIDGSLIFDYSILKVQLKRVRKSFGKIRLISGFLQIHVWPSGASSFDVFENLEEVAGRTLYNEKYAVDIRDDNGNNKDSLSHIKSLGFKSLKNVTRGIVFIGYLKNLCYYNLDWKDILHASKTYNDTLNLKEIGTNCSSTECNENCKYCAGPDLSDCTKCANFKHNETCTLTCGKNLYGDKEQKLCLPCHHLCDSCNGSEIDNCLTCKYFKDVKTNRCGCNCSKNCEEACEDKVIVKQKKISQTTIFIMLSAFIIIVFIILAVFVRQKRRKMVLSEAFDSASNPLVPVNNNSHIRPNKVQLRIVKETELKIGSLLGSGAFGEVYKGYWIPDELIRGKRVKVPVAIKILKNDNDVGSDTELLKEAGFMASCDHPNLVRLLGVSVSSRIILISQLMVLGNLLNYVRNNREKIGSQYILNWSLQISQGMQYLSEEKHLVHRDLAARNVLLKSPTLVKITDFGLAKLLDVKNEAYKAHGGKMPIKWLALESIQHQLFTQKSDVWSFGVTMWELMTFGEKPYEGTAAYDILPLLLKGERLPQPKMCTLEVYMLLIRCWMVEIDSRPTFQQLSEELRRMAQEPKRFLFILNEQLQSQVVVKEKIDSTSVLAKDKKSETNLDDTEDYLLPQITQDYVTIPEGTVLLKNKLDQSWKPFIRNSSENVNSNFSSTELDAFNETDSIVQYSGNPLPASSVSLKSGYVDSIHFDEQPSNGAKFGLINKYQNWISKRQGPVIGQEKVKKNLMAYVTSRPHSNTITTSEITSCEDQPKMDDLTLHPNQNYIRYKEISRKPQKKSSNLYDAELLDNNNDGYLSPIAASRKIPEYYDLSLRSPLNMKSKLPMGVSSTTENRPIENPTYQKDINSITDTGGINSDYSFQAATFPNTSMSCIKYENIKTRTVSENHTTDTTTELFCDSFSQIRDSGINTDEDDSISRGSKDAQPVPSNSFMASKEKNLEKSN